MHKSLLCALLLPVMTLAAGCAGGSGNYPDFTIPTGSNGDGRISASFPGVKTTTPPTASGVAEPLPAELDAALAAIRNRAAKAVNGFDEDKEQARAHAQSAAGRSVESDQWAQAQVSLANLTSHQSETALALADLDMLAARASTNLEDPAKMALIAADQTRLAKRLTQQQAVIDTLSRQLER